MSYKGLLKIKNPSMGHCKKGDVSDALNVMKTSPTQFRDTIDEFKTIRKANKVDRSRDTLIQWLLKCIFSAYQ